MDGVAAERVTKTEEALSEAPKECAIAYECRYAEEMRRSLEQQLPLTIILVWNFDFNSTSLFHPVATRGKTMFPVPEHVLPLPLGGWVAFLR